MRRPTFAIFACALLTSLLAAPPAGAAPARQISYQTWDLPSAQRTLPTGVDRRSWTSPWATPGFALTRLVASWEARTPGRSRVRIDVRGKAGASTSSWDTLAVWAQGDRHFKRTTRGEQADDLGSVSVDTWVVPDGVTSYQLRVTLLRRAGQKASPRVDTVGAMSSLLPSVSSVPTSKPGVARGVVLDVPAYSQMVHRGHYPEYGAGGEAWCSPTSTAMVLGYYDALPGAAAYSWVPAGHPDPWVDHVARMTYDYAYEGTGNWPFNTAYAATRVDHAFVTRLRSLREAEELVRAGIPVVASIAFDPGGLTGAPIGSTDGHLLVIVGFTADGDVVVNDPAAATDAEVRRTYDRGEFENAWIPTSGGTVYVIADAAHPLPAGHTNW
ncbi:peptidase C39 family protein [Nocardioides sp. MAH-18]|uniref:Peptidase C39 family protein n=1 Tax=Nocardioides agri TaxID=2682843 RepID=A0A6L6XS39_9ACTN|nr:peptidase C39 family protein [Nocardioides sp. CGMCC 1.13656]MBA2954465.1 peptidase C39 family protein [Nocardioides sp. CGMCC 1.13656]MVQ49326.1 peptidase C39 family protein [Nocardioides sp. MAH-18]